MHKMPKKYQFEKVFKLFEEHYVLVPLEIFGADPYKTLISTVMSARTKDEVTLEAAKRLFSIAPGFGTLKKLSEEDIAKTIYPVGFYKTKAKHLKELARVVDEELGGIVPREQRELVKLPGVGIKTANLVRNRAYGVPDIAVDTHVHRISNLLGWVTTKTPQETEKTLKATVPEKYWTDMNRLFVSIGRSYGTGSKLHEFLKKHDLL